MFLRCFELLTFSLSLFLTTQAYTLSSLSLPLSLLSFIIMAIVVVVDYDDVEDDMMTMILTMMLMTTSTLCLTWKNTIFRIKKFYSFYVNGRRRRRKLSQNKIIAGGVVMSMGGKRRLNRGLDEEQE